MDIVIVVDIGIVNGDNDTFIGTFEDYINIIIILLFIYFYYFISSEPICRTTSQ